jgi:hypothetical protein
MTTERWHNRWKARSEKDGRSKLANYIDDA